MRVDLLATRPHYLDHLLPVWRALPDNLRGERYDRHLVAGDTPVLVASWSDLEEANRWRRPAIMFEHGIGQSYSNNHPGYAGGTGRDGVMLFIVPSAQVAERNAKTHYKIPNVAVGSPRLDRLKTIERVPARTTVAISFHWRCKVARESGTALEHYRTALEPLRNNLANLGIDLIGHGHPRAWNELKPMYLKLGIEPVEDFDDVVRRADLYVCDNSSTIFEFAALGRPVLLMNSPKYRRTTEHGLRFWSEADVGIQVDTDHRLLPGVLDALADPPAQRVARMRAVQRVYAHLDGSSTTRAVAAIAAVLHNGKPPSGAAHMPVPSPREVRRMSATEDEVGVGTGEHEGSRLVRANVAFYAGLKPGRIGWVPNELADTAINMGYAVAVDTLSSRLAFEPGGRVAPESERYPAGTSGVEALATEMRELLTAHDGIDRSYVETLTPPDEFGAQHVVDSAGGNPPGASYAPAQTGEATGDERVGLTIPPGKTGELTVDDEGNSTARIVEGS